MPYLAFDIETVVSDRAKDLFAQTDFQAPSNYKDPEKIEKAILQKRETEMQKAALYWWTGKIICISCVNEDGEPHSWAGLDEKRVLSDFFRVLLTRYPKHTLIGKSAGQFDIPYTIGRAMACDVGLVPHLRHAKEPLNDVNRIFHVSDSCNQVSSLANYAFGLDLPPKLGKGSEINEWYALALAGDPSYWEKIQTYCVRDSMLVLEILKRYQKVFSVDPVRTFAVDGTF